MLKVYLIVVGSIFVLAALWMTIARVRFLRRRKLAIGRIVSWAEHSDQESPPSVFYHAVVTFRDKDGVERRFLSRVGYDRPARPAGDTLKVEYDPTAPENAIEATFAARWGFCTVVAGLGIAAMSIGLSM